MANLSAAIELADRAYLYDNSVDDAEARLCVRLQDGLVRKIYCTLPEWVALAIEGRPRTQTSSMLAWRGANASSRAPSGAGGQAPAERATRPVHAALVEEVVGQ